MRMSNLADDYHSQTLDVSYRGKYVHIWIVRCWTMSYRKRVSYVGESMYIFRLSEN